MSTSTFSTPGPITTTVSTAGARVRLVAGDRSDTVVQVEPVDSTSEFDVSVAENTTVTLSGNALSIKTTKSGDRGGSVAITVELPAESRLVLQATWTNVRSDGPLGDCELNVSSGGGIQLDRVGALRVNLAAGDVTVGHVAGTADIQTRSATGVRLGEVGGTVRYMGTTGELWVGHARSDVDVSSAGGSIEVDRAEGSVTAEADRCPIRVGWMARGRAELVNGSGGIEVGISEGVAVSVDAKSTKGEVRDSVSQDGSAATGERVQVHARTRLDDIVIHRVSHRASA